MGFLYTLKDPRHSDTDKSNHIRYIGITTKTLNERFKGHIAQSKLSKRKSSYCCNWIRQLAQDGQIPIMELLEEVPDEYLKEREIQRIQEYRDSGCRLTNITAGGDGLLNPTPEYRKKLSERLMGENNPNYGKKHTPDIIFKMRQPRSEDGKKAIAESNKKRIGLPLSQTAKNKMSITRMGVKHSGQWQKGIVPWNKGKKNPYTEEVLLRMSNSHKGYKWGTESRKKLSETIKGRPAWNKGIPHSEETKRRISESGRGHIPWNKGLRVANV